MIRNYLKSFLRFLRRHTAYSINNILGLSIGLAAAVLIYLWILDELSFDKHHDNYDNICRIVTTMKNSDGGMRTTVTAAPLASKLEESFPEIIETARFKPSLSEMLVSHGENIFYEKEIAFVDKEFFRIFTHPFIFGSDHDPFPDKHSAVISEQVAQKYFGSENPIGKTITLDNQTIITVSGVIEDVPANSNLKFNILINFEMIEELGLTVHWENLSYYAYALMSENVDHPALKAQIDTLTKELYSHGSYEFFLQPLSDVHLRSSFDYDVNSSLPTQANPLPKKFSG